MAQLLRCTPTDSEVFGRIIGGPDELEFLQGSPPEMDRSLICPVDLKQLPQKLADVEWPPKQKIRKMFAWLTRFGDIRVGTNRRYGIRKPRLNDMNWDECYQKGEAFWDKGIPSLPMTQYLERNPVRGRRWCRGAAVGMRWLWRLGTGWTRRGWISRPRELLRRARFIRIWPSAS
jgi:hypothetical protein